MDAVRGDEVEVIFHTYLTLFKLQKITDLTFAASLKSRFIEVYETNSLQAVRSSVVVLNLWLSGRSANWLGLVFQPLNMCSDGV